MARETMKPPIISLALIFLVSLSRFHVIEASGFSVDLIQRDSLGSPDLLSLTPSQRVGNALKRSFSRAEKLLGQHSPESAPTEVIQDRGEYLMKISLGTPPVERMAIADTASDLIWVQCTPCFSCYKQDGPLFDQTRSSSYRAASCDSNTCKGIPRTSCEGTCAYTIIYGDRSYSAGEVATETVTLTTTTKENVSIPNVVLGCGQSDKGTFSSGTSGVIGLGAGNESLISQTSSLIHGKFSYCLVPSFSGTRTNPSRMNFGDNAVVSDAGVVSTPLVAKPPSTLYYLTLDGMTVGKRRYDLDSSSSDCSEASEEGNMIIDTGTTLTFLPADLYAQVIDALSAQVKLRQTRDPDGRLELCYSSSGDIAGLPEMTAHFRGADVKLTPANTFIKTGEGTLCLAFAPAKETGIYGNLAQENFLVGYDLEKEIVYFKPTDCGRE